MIGGLMTQQRTARPSLIPPMAILAGALLAAAAPARATVITCRPTWDFSVEVEGSYPRDAQFYRADERGKFLIDIPACKDGLLMDLGSRKIFAVPRVLMTSADGTVQVRDLPSGGAAYAFSVEGPVIQFSAENKKVRILPVLMRPPVTGPVEIDALVADRPEYRAGMKNYSTHPESIAAMNKFSKTVELECFFATWCGHCKEYMPKLLRVLQDAKNPKIKTNLIGVPKNFGKEPGPWDGKNVAMIPTIIVRVDGKEITRLGTHPEATPEVELAGIFDALK